MKKKRKFFCRGVLVSCFIFLLILSGCSGDANDADVKVNGQAMKGTPVYNADVSIFKLSDGKIVETAIGEGTTGLDGKFSIDIGYYKGPLLIKVEGGKYVNTQTMSEMPLLKPLRAVVVNLTGNENIPVNDITDLAVDTAFSEPNGLTAVRINESNKQVSILLGSDGSKDLITTIMPLNPTKEASQDSSIKNYSALIGAFAYIPEGTTQNSFSAVRTALSSALITFSESSYNKAGITKSDAENLSNFISKASYTPLTSTGIKKYAFTLIQTTDMHNRGSGVGTFADYTPLSTNDDSVLGGYSRIAAKIEEIRYECSKNGVPVVLVDSGDYLMGTVYDLTVEDPIAFRFMEMMKYDAVTVGNHEFDYSPLGLGLILSNAIKSGFSRPIITSNMVLDGKQGTSDDGIELLKKDGKIKDKMIVTLANGLKIGIIGLMGQEADSYAPAAPPVTFNHAVEFIQSMVDDLRNEGAQFIIALSHSGVKNPNGINADGTAVDPSGDDIDMVTGYTSYTGTVYNGVTGIDIIAAGHDHQTTSAVIKKNDTYIVCAGSYGTNLLRLDVTFSFETKKIEETKLNNIKINDSFLGSAWVQYIIDTVDNILDQGLKQLDPNLSLAGTIGVALTDNVGMVEKACETGLGNLLSDAVRYTLQPYESLGVINTPTIGAVGSGVIRGGFTYGQKISFADMFSVLPLGISPATDQEVVMPGYPLVMIYFTGAEIKNLCQFTAYILGSLDKNFMSYLASGDATQQALYGALSYLKESYYINFSGVKYSHLGLYGGYQVKDVMVYPKNDYQCTQTPSLIDDATYYPCVADIYMLLMIQNQSLQYLLTSLGLPVKPKYAPSSDALITSENILNCRLDAKPDSLGGTPGIQEVLEWQALLNYLISPASKGGLESVISDNYYGTQSMGRVMSDK
ncbi:MAG: bifunctional metallophosphatase/5'-nucleotidase [Desulfobacterales bacterium]|nr:bifunctional metallophosphatase/5'-nucleotidase [Desulfobacterales bacterium]